MVGILLISHANFAKGLLSAVKMIVGDVECIEAMSIDEGEGIEIFEQKIVQGIISVDNGDGVLILADLFGASPCNFSAKLLLEGENVEVVSGMNLPMILEVVMQRNGKNLSELTSLAVNCGKDGIINISSILE